MRKNFTDIKIALVMSTRNNFSEKLARNAAKNLEILMKNENLDFFRCPLMVGEESDISDILNFLNENNCNALVIILGNFGAEIPETILAEKFSGPVMFAGITEDSLDSMYASRRDSYCGMLNCSYNLGIRNIRAYMPRRPIGTYRETVENIKRFIVFSRVIVNLKLLKIITFGPRPNDFVACNAPIKGLYDLGVEIQENSELDLYLAFQKHKNDPRIPELVSEMSAEPGCDRYPDTLPSMAQYQLTLSDWAAEHKGDREHIAFANKCWPAFQQAFGFLPCYVHSRLGSEGFMVGCETDVYGALSEYIGLCLSERPAALMDINNAIPGDLYKKVCTAGYQYQPNEIFMGFHCGNTSSCLLENPNLTYKLDRKDPYAPETGKELTRGTLEGRLIPGPATLFRLHSAPNGELQAYIANSEILPVEINTYGNYGLFAVKEMERFYRYVLLAKRFPHHAAVAFGDHAEALFDVLDYLGISFIGCNQPTSIPYANENPFYVRQIPKCICDK